MKRLFLLFFLIPVFAGSLCSLTVTCSYQDMTIPGVEVSLYPITNGGSWSYELTGQSYIASLSMDAEKTDDFGTVTFSDLPSGDYLVFSGGAKRMGVLYGVKPAVVTVSDGDVHLDLEYEPLSDDGISWTVTSESGRIRMISSEGEQVIVPAGVATDFFWLLPTCLILLFGLLAGISGVLLFEKRRG